MTSIQQQPNDNIYQNKVFSHNEKTEQEQHQQPGLITPPMSPTNPASFISSSSRRNTARNSLKITAGQTGLPWLSRDTEEMNHRSNNSVTEEGVSAGSPTVSGHNTVIMNSPPPKFMARPKTTSIIRIPTRKRTMQKHIYCMKDGLDPVKLLSQRLSSWQISVKYLTSMFHSIKKVESNTGKGYRKIDSNFSIPAKIENQFKSSNGVKDAWSAFRQYTRENSLIHQDFVDFIENDIVPTLNIMLKEIGHYMDDLKKNKKLRTTTLWDCRKRADAVITRLNSDIYATVNQQEKESSPYVIPKKDPLLTKYVVINTIQDLYKQENRLHKDFLETQDKYRQFEQENIINVYIQLFQTFEDYRVDHRLENLEGVSKVVSLFSAIEQDAEWIDFLHHHENELVKQTAIFKDEQNLDFPNVSHPFVQPLVLGNLQRHHGKKWTEEYYLLSPVGLLHSFKSEDAFHQSPTKPDITMFIPQCTVLINPTNHLLELRGKTLSGHFGSKKFLELSSAQPDVIKHWIEILGPMALQQETAVIDTPPPPAVAATTEADDRSVHSKVLAEEDDHLHHEQPAAESSRSGAEAAAIGASAAAAGAATNADNDNKLKEMQEPVTQQEEEHNNINPITNNSSHLAAVPDDSTTTDEDDYRRETVEYSTHTPLTEDATDEYNPFVTKDKHNAASSLPTAVTANTGIIASDSAAKPTGLTREGSDLYWDTKTSVTASDK